MFRLITILPALLCSSVALAAPYHTHLSWQGPTASTMTVTWRSYKSNGQVQYGTSASLGKTATATSRSFAGSHLHVAQLSGLKQGTLYHYRCGASGAWSKGYSFRTAPSPGTTIRMVAMGDSRSDDAKRALVRAGVQQRNPMFTIHTGDFVSSGGSQSQWNAYFKTMEPLLAVSPMMGAIGNHENKAQIYFDQFAFPSHSPKGSAPGEAYYSFDYGNMHFIAVSTEHSPKKGDHQYNWLRNDLIAAAKKPHLRWVVAFGHRPPYSSGSHGSYTAAQTAWGHLFESFGVDISFWGHDHTYERTKPLFQGQVVPSDGVIYVVTGGAGAPLYTAKGAYFTAVAKKLYHYTELTVTNSTFKLEAREPNGKIFDSLTLTKSGPKPMWVMEGAVDAASKVLGSKTSGELRNLRAGYQGGYLYLATQGTPASKDHFILVSPTKPGAKVAAPWKKAGKVWTPAAMLTMESSSGWSGWQVSGQGQIAWGSTWKYHHQGKDLGTGWRAASYNDASWPSGPAQLGYGDNDEKTKLKNPSPNYPSAYFRKTFNLAKVPKGAKLTVLHDDGAAVWINGTQVLSKYMGHGTGYGAWASSTSSDNQKTSTTVTQGPSGPFKAGKNVLAVMIKQANASSSDLSFDLQLQLGTGHLAGARASNPAGQLMEGSLDVKRAFGYTPKEVYLAAAAYGTSDSGALSEQLPKGNGNGDVDLNEWYVLKLGGAPPPDAGPKTDGPKKVDGPKPPIKDGSGPQPDNGKPSAEQGEVADAGVKGEGETETGNCSCGLASSGAGQAWPLLGLLLLATLRRRRR